MRAVPATPPPLPDKPVSEDMTTALYRAAVGPVNTDYYLAWFNKFDAAERMPLGWNWAASLCTLNWLALRQLWNVALMYCGAVVALALFIFGIGKLVFQFSETVQLALLLFFGLLTFLLPGMFGNAVYHHSCRKRMTQTLRESSDDGAACAALTRQATTRRRFFGLALANAAVAGLVFAAYMGVNELTTLASSGLRPLEAPPSAAASKPATPVSASAPVVATPQTAASAPSAPASAPKSGASAATAAPCEGCLRNIAGTAGRATQGPVQTESAKSEAAKDETSRAVSAEPAKAAASSMAKPPAKAASGVVASASKPAASTPAKASTKAAAASAPATTASEPHPAVNTSGKYLINVGLFAEEKNASKTFDKLQGAGLPATSQILTTSKGPRTRVRVGPYDTQEEAKSAVEKIRALSLDAIIVAP